MASVDPVRSDVALLYRRAGFGARPDELDAAAAAGYEASVERLLAGGQDPALAEVADPRLTLPAPAQLRDPAERALVLRSLRPEQAELTTWWLRRMVLASRPFAEKVTLFWHGHFATAITKVRLPALMWRQNEIFRSEGTGAFDALTTAVAEDPAMLIWLDAATDKKAHPNENFARELMELFTLGLGNYTEADVQAGARAFTGWRLDRASWHLAVASADHDNSVKTFLGRTGNLNGQDVIQIVTHQPASARWVASRVWSRFAYPVSPAAPVLDDLVAAYGSQLDLAALFRAVFLHPEFRSVQSRSGLVKQPIEYVVGAVRALAPGLMAEGSSAVGGKGAPLVRALGPLLRELGQVPFDPPNVGGWPQNQAWLSTASAQMRLRFASALARVADLSAVAAAPVAQRPDEVARVLGVDAWGPTTAAVLAGAADEPDELVTLALVSPEYVTN